MVGLVGVETKSGKSASRQRSYERSSSDVKERCSREPEPRERHAMFQRERFATGALFFNSPICPALRAACSNPIVRMGRSPAHVQACWAGKLLGGVMSLHFWARITLSIIYPV